MELLTSEQIEKLEEEKDKLRERLSFLRKFVIEENSYLTDKRISEAQYISEIGMIDRELREYESQYNLPPIDKVMGSPLKQLDKIWIAVGKRMASYDGK